MLHNNNNSMEAVRSKIGTFFVDNDMTLLTIRTSPEVYKKLVRKSIYIALAWLQKYILLSDSFHNKKLQFISSFNFNMETNTQLIRYCTLLINMTPKLKPIINYRTKKWFFDNVVTDELYITELFPNKYLISVYVEHESHKDLVPISELII